MADKLGESLWTAFTKKHKLSLDDAPLVKALARWDKTDEGKHAPRLEALGEVVEQVNKQVVALARRKKEFGDKVFAEVKGRLDSLRDLAEELQGQTRAAAKAAEEEEEDSPALLSTRMIPLLRELRKGESRMPALICTAGRATSVLIMRRAIAPARRKMLAEAVDAKGGAKYFAGECLLENEALTFIVQGAAGGLAKRVRQALLDQTELRLKVRVRGDDGSEDQDDEEEGSQARGEGSGETGNAALSEQGGGQSQEPSALEAAYRTREAAVQSALDAALRAQHPEATKLRALMGFASEKAHEQQDYAAAAKALEKIEALLAAAPVATSGGAAEATAAAPGPLVTLQRSRLAWDAARKRVQQDLNELRKAVINEYKGTPRQAEAMAAQAELADVLGAFDTRLIDALDLALDAPEPARRVALQGAARMILDEYRAELDSNALLQAIDANPFVPVKIFATLDQTLKVLGKQLAA